MKASFLILGTAALALGAAATQQDGSFDRNLTVSGPVDLDITTDSGGITILPGSSSSVHVHAILKAQHGWLDSTDAEAHIRELERNPPVEQNGNRIRIGYVHDRSLLKGVSMRLEIQTPPDTRVHATADSGGVHVEGIQGPADCHTDSGGIEIRNVRADVRAAADSGGIRISNINGSAFARVDSGGIEVLEVAGPIDVEADSGGIRVSQTKPAPIRAHADSGGVNVKLAPAAGYDVNAESDSGRISVPEIALRGDFSRHKVDGKVRGGGPLVSIHVDSGNITIE
jgi:hypothetical protein